jgi:hypothetical protein
MTAGTQRAEAREILNSCTAATWRPVVAWAAGVYLAQHASNFYNLPLPPRSLAPEYTGGTGDNRFWDADRRSFRITEYVTAADADRTQRAVVLTLKWPEIEGLVTVDQVGSPLHQQIRAALATRRDRTPTHDPRRPSTWHRTDEGQLERRLWAEIEAECYELGALAWRRCRPTRAAVAPVNTQLDLFAELVA